MQFPAEKKITVQVRIVYGRPLIYPADETAEAFAELVGMKCLREEHIPIIKRLGYQVEQIHALQL